MAEIGSIYLVMTFEFQLKHLHFYKKSRTNYRQLRLTQMLLAEICELKCSFCERNLVGFYGNCLLTFTNGRVISNWANLHFCGIRHVDVWVLPEIFNFTYEWKFMQTGFILRLPTLNCAPHLSGNTFYSC